MVGSQPRRNKGWEEGPGGLTASTITGSSTVFMGSAVQPLVDGLTLLRTRGLLTYFLTSVTALADGFQGAFGIAKATAAAVTAGVASVPTPITEQQWDGWLFWTPISCHASVALQASSSPATMYEIVIDSKAMRKIAAEEAFYAIIELTEIGAASFTAHFDSRMLFALP